MKDRLKHKISTTIRAVGRKIKKYQIRIRLTYMGLRFDIATGYSITSKKVWDAKHQCVVAGYVGPSGETANEINNGLENRKEKLDNVFKFFEAEEIRPTPEQVIHRFEERMGILHGKENKIKDSKKLSTEKTTSRQTEKDKKTAAPKADDVRFVSVMQKFVIESSVINSWSESTAKKFYALKNDILEFDRSMKISDFSESKLASLVVFFREKKTLRTPRKKKGDRKEYDHDDVVGLSNTTIFKKLGYLRWVLRWAENHGYSVDPAYKTFAPSLKVTQKKVIYLTSTDLEAIKNLKLEGDLARLEACRDSFLFCCYSSLRYSDAYNLKKSDVRDSYMDVTTIKTADTVRIEMNNVSRAILDKYKDVDLPENRALPCYTNQAMNRDVKELCRLAGINEEIRITTYKGNVRKDVVKPKWQLVGTHTGRRTFIVQALSLGIAPDVVMKWTGHSDYKAMKPYIDIVDSVKANEMTKFNSL